MQFLTSLIGALILAHGLFGWVNPSGFAEFVGGMQVPPALYFATAIRIVTGMTLIFCALSTRTPVTMRIIGALIAVGGASSPLVGDTFARPVLRWWAEGGDMVVRLWATLAVAIGSFVLYVSVPRLGATKDKASPPGSNRDSQ